MRKIKFKLWNGKEIIDVKSIEFDDVGNLLYVNSELVNPLKVKLLQYTGLKDRSKTDIYEGYILELINETGKRVTAVCKFGNRRLRTGNGDVVDIQCFYFQIGDRKTNPMAINYKGVHDLEIMEVRGNVYESPELLNNIS